MKLCFQKICVFVIVFCLTFSLGFKVADAQTDKQDPTVFWLTLASNAWNYFQPGVGVDAQTGIVLGSTGYPYITDWDNCLYIQAVLDAEKLGLLEPNGTWGANDRIDKILAFLENRPLTTNRVPYVSYSSITGKNATNIVQIPADSGALLAALKNLEEAKPELKTRVDNIVYNFTNYEPLKKVVNNLLGMVQNGEREPEIYDYFVIKAFACFWPQRFSAEADAMLDVYFSAPTINYSGVALPAVELTSEPLLMCNFYFQQPDSRLLDLTKQTYLAQEARYNITGKYTAFSEGISESGFIYEWVATSSTRMWVIQTIEGYDDFTEINITPVVYLEAAIGYLALYNTAYSQDMASFVLNQLPFPSNGYKTGIYENGNVVQTSPDDGNSLIISAARYAVDNNIDTSLTYPTKTSSVSKQPETAEGTAKDQININRDTSQVQKEGGENLESKSQVQPFSDTNLTDTIPKPVAISETTTQNATYFYVAMTIALIVVTGIVIAKIAKSSKKHRKM